MALRTLPPLRRWLVLVLLVALVTAVAAEVPVSSPVTGVPTSRRGYGGGGGGLADAIPGTNLHNFSRWYLRPADVLRINVGGSAVDGFAADRRSLVQGWSITRVWWSSPVYNRAGLSQAIYTSFRSALRSSTFTYSLRVPVGTYTVRLHFAEIDRGAMQWGKRVFSVSLEGVRVLSNFDIYREVGAYTATVKTFTTKVTDGILNIGFHSVVQNAVVMAIEVVPAQQRSHPPTPTPTASGTPTSIHTPTAGAAPTPTSTPMPTAGATPMLTSTPTPTDSATLTQARPVPTANVVTKRKFHGSSGSRLHAQSVHRRGSSSKDSDSKDSKSKDSESKDSESKGSGSKVSHSKSSHSKSSHREDSHSKAADSKTSDDKSPHNKGGHASSLFLAKVSKDKSSHSKDRAARCNVRPEDCSVTKAAIAERYLNSQCLPHKKNNKLVATASALTDALSVIGALGCCARDIDRAMCLKLASELAKTDTCAERDTVPPPPGVVTVSPHNSTTVPSPPNVKVPLVRTGVTTLEHLGTLDGILSPGGSASETVVREQLISAGSDEAEQERQLTDEASQLDKANRRLGFSSARASVVLDIFDHTNDLRIIDWFGLHKKSCCPDDEFNYNGRGCCENICWTVADILPFFTLSDCCMGDLKPFHSCH
ncbi:hypothetical protein MMPV_002001 [Pyropia vietnamensis]